MYAQLCGSSGTVLLPQTGTLIMLKTFSWHSKIATFNTEALTTSGLWVCTKNVMKLKLLSLTFWRSEKTYQRSLAVHWLVSKIQKIHKKRETESAKKGPLQNYKCIWLCTYEST